MSQDMFERLAKSGELGIWSFSASGKVIVAAVTRMDDSEMPHYKVEPRPDACGLCFKDPAEGYASIGDLRFCHGDDDPEPTCYMRAQWQLSFGNTPYPPATPEGDDDGKEDEG